MRKRGNARVRLVVHEDSIRACPIHAYRHQSVARLRAPCGRGQAEAKDRRFPATHTELESTNVLRSARASARLNDARAITVC